MKASSLRHRITLLTQQSVVNELGEHLAEWTPIKKIWAHVTPLSVKDVIAAQGTGSRMVARCTIRYQAGITSGMRIVHKDQLYDITGDPLPDPRTGKEYLTLMLESISGD